jgi:hypothetical protein
MVAPSAMTSRPNPGLAQKVTDVRSLLKLFVLLLGRITLIKTKQKQVQGQQANPPTFVI